MPKRKYQPSHERREAERAARYAGYIPASFAADILGASQPHLAEVARTLGIPSRAVGRAAWYELASIQCEIDKRAAAVTLARRAITRAKRKAF